jgi:hypothetical protein
MKWGVVAAGASDFLRPAEKLSLTQNMALVATGSIWTRWCFVIRPQNMLYVTPRPQESTLVPRFNGPPPGFTLTKLEQSGWC